MPFPNYKGWLSTVQVNGSTEGGFPFGSLQNHGIRALQKDTPHGTKEL